MWWCHVLLVASVSFLASNDFLLEVKTLTAASPASLVSANLFATETTQRRFLRTENTGGYSFQDIDRGDGINSDFEVDKRHTKGREERAGETAPLQKLKSLNTFGRRKSLKTLKSLSRTVSKATNSFSEKISPALPIESRLRIWFNNKKSVSFVRKELRLDGLDGDALTQAKNFQFYDDYVTSQLPVWAKRELTPDEVVSELGLHGLSGAALTSNPNFKYYDEFLVQQALVWAKKDVDVDAILVRLGLNTLPAAARPEAVNYKYYEEFVAGLMRSWMEKGVPVIEVMAKFKLDKLTGAALLSHPNYKYYKNYVKNNLKAWAADLKSLEYVVDKLGLKAPRGKVHKGHPNIVFLEKLRSHADKYRERLWLKQGVTSYDAWIRLEVDRVRETMRRDSDTYKAYENYVNLIDDYIIRLKTKGAKDTELPRMTRDDASELELYHKTLIWAAKERPEWYVKFSLGLDGMDETALKGAANYKHYKSYLGAVNAAKDTV
ncbi:hypothetical protein PC128_g14525 [Phytophthora cactorum]|nr:hypothetical protein PC120_g11356 [Phytophthora cactorum]KAG3076555.1 hypothetical protein PC121_g7685 [Phytophthora cactorum]KAG3182780.1 hypothetical protein PC128_g14525 [Phytophthora cactorum]KAG4053719.1 hypothetical protein PC123_g11139 [Phytophthora cactorum]